MVFKDPPASNLRHSPNSMSELAALHSALHEGIVSLCANRMAKCIAEERADMKIDVGSIRQVGSKDHESITLVLYRFIRQSAKLGYVRGGGTSKG